MKCLSIGYAFSMEKRKKKEHDFSVTAFRVVQETTGQKEKTKPKERILDFVELGRRGGLKGGKARAERITPDRRKEIAQKAAMVRWGKGI